MIGLAPATAALTLAARLSTGLPAGAVTEPLPEVVDVERA